MLILFHIPILIKSKLKRLFHRVVSVLLIAGFLILIFSGIVLLWSFISTINEDLAVGIIAGVTTIVVSVGSVLIAKYIEQQNIIRNEHRERKIPIYTKLMTFLFERWQEAKDGKKADEKEVSDFLLKFTQELVIWGSDDVIITFCEFRSSDHDSKSVLLSIEKIWVMIRKDLGHRNIGIVRGMLLGLFVTDIDKFLRGA